MFNLTLKPKFWRSNVVTFIDIFFSKRVIISLILIICISLILTPFHLVGVLGFEFSVIIAFASAFISLFISAEFVNLDLKKGFMREKRFSDVVSSIFIVDVKIGRASCRERV